MALDVDEPSAENGWYVDAWAVRDGRIFASDREPESIDARSTIFLAVPDLEPVPIGRISTALRATRSGFQEGFRDGDGNEIRFDSVAQIRELCRRGFLGGGLGPGAPGVGPLPYPVPNRDAPGGAQLAEDSISLHIERWNPEMLRRAIDRVDPRAFFPYAEFARRCFISSLQSWVEITAHYERSDHSAGMQHVSEALHRCSFWLRENGVLNQAHHAGPPGPWLLAPQLRRNDIAQIPLPFRNYEYPITRLDELAILASITEDFMSNNVSYEKLVPVAMTYLVRRASERHPVVQDPARSMRNALLDVARHAPAVELPTAANEALSSWIGELLGHGTTPNGGLASR